MPPRSISLFREIVSGVGAYGVSLVLGFFLSPYLIRSLGDTRYGIWSIVSDIVGYYGLLDLGITGAVGHYVARYAADGRGRDLRYSVSTAFGLLVLVGLLALPLGIFVAVFFADLFPSARAETSEAAPAILVLALTIALSLPMAVFPAILMGQRRQHVSNTIDVSSRVLTALFIIAALQFNGGLIGVAIAQLGGKCVTWIAAASAVLRCDPDLLPRARHCRIATLKKLVSFGGQNSGINLAWIVINQTGNLVVGVFLGVQWVTYYSVGAMLVQYGSGACSAITRSFTPHFTHLHALGASSELNDLFLRGVRLAGLFSATLVAGMLVWGGPLISLWIGPAYVSSPLTFRSDVVMTVLLLGHLPRLLQSISWQILFASRSQEFLLRLTLVEAVANLSLTVILVRHFELLGVAIGTFVPLVISNLFFLPRFVVRRFGLTWRRYLSEGVARPLVCGVLSVVMMSVLRAMLPPLTWTCLFIGISASAAIAGLFAWFLGLSREERQAVCAQLSHLYPEQRSGPAVATKSQSLGKGRVQPPAHTNT